MKILATSLMLLMTSGAWAVDYPTNLQGKWVALENNQKNACENPQIVVEKNQRYDEVDVMCRPIKVTAQKISNTITNYVVSERCAREDSKWVQTTTFELGGLMLVTEKRKQDTMSFRLKFCQ